MRKLLTVLTVAVMALTLAGPSASGDAVDLPRGPDTTTPYFTYRTLHVGSAELSVPGSVGGPSSWFRLVGRSTRGWVIAHVNHDGPQPSTTLVELYFLSSAGATRFYQHRYGEDAGVHARLSDDRTRVLTWVTGPIEGPDGADAAVIDLNGKTLRHRFFKHNAQMLDFSGTRLVTTRRFGATRVWRLGHKPHVISRREAFFASFETNTLALKASHSRWRMSSISRPIHVRWQAKFQPVRTSPNQRLVVGFSTSKPGRPIEVRRLRNGHLLTTWRGTGVLPESDLTWESNKAVIGYSLRENGTFLMVRCHVGAACERASDPIGLPQFEFSRSN